MALTCIIEETRPGTSRRVASPRIPLSLIQQPSVAADTSTPANTFPGVILEYASNPYIYTDAPKPDSFIIYKDSSPHLGAIPCQLGIKSEHYLSLHVFFFRSRIATRYYRRARLNLHTIEITRARILKASLSRWILKMLLH